MFFIHRKRGRKKEAEAGSNGKDGVSIWLYAAYAK
jgi:hypothetical protein